MTDVGFARSMLRTREALQRFVITDRDGAPYLERVVLEKDRTYLHVIYKGDDDRDPHDHPWDFTSLIVWGSYVEHSFLPEPCRDGMPHRWDGPGGMGHCTACGADRAAVNLVPRRDVYRSGMHNHKDAADLHRLELPDGPVVTLVRRGPTVRRWGFMTQHGWVDHNSYLDAKFGAGNWDKTYE